MSERSHPTDHGNGTVRNNRLAVGGGGGAGGEWSFWALNSGGTRAVRGDQTIWEVGAAAPARTRAQHGARRVVIVRHDRPIWCDRAGETVVTLSEDGLGCRLDAYRGSDGTALWSKVVPLPAPSRFAQPWPGAQTNEEILAFLTDTPDALALCLQRTTPTSAEWPASIPPFESALELRGLDPLTGESRWRLDLPGVHIGILDRRLYEGLHAAAVGVFSVDLCSGVLRPLHRWDAPPRVIAQPRRVGRNVVSACSRGSVTRICVVDEGTAATVAVAEVPRGAKRTLDIKHADGVIVVNIDAQGYVVLGPAPGFVPSPVIRIKGYFDGLTAETDGGKQVACIDGRSALVRVDVATGAVLSTSTPPRTQEELRERTRALLGDAGHE